MRLLKIASVLALALIVLGTTLIPVMADSPDRIPTSGPKGGSATAEELATAMDVPANLIVSTSLGTSDPAGTHVFVSPDVTSTGFVYPTGKKPKYDPPVSYGYGGACRYYDYAGWLARGDRDWNNDGVSDYLPDKYHIGQDIKANVGDRVYAIADGRIVLSHYDADGTRGWGKGNYGVFVRHELNTGEEFLALYGHVRPPGGQSFADGQEVVAGEAFAKIGPLSSPHLHFGICRSKDVPSTHVDLENPRDNRGWGMMGLNHWDDLPPANTNGFVDPIEWINTRTPDTAVGASFLLGFPTSGNSFAAISSGNAQNAVLPNSSGSLSTVLGGLNNNQGNDLVQLTLTLKVPTWARYWAVDWRFLSEEYPEWVGTQYNDAFLIETTSSTFTISGWTITAPNNVAVDPSGKLVTINTTGAVGMSAAHAAGTTYDGSTETLTTVAPIPSGTTNVTLVFSVMDLGDSIYDTTVFLDNFRFVSMAEIPLWQEVVDTVWEGLVQAKKNLGETGATTLDAAGPWLNLLSVMTVIGACLAPEPASKTVCAGAITKVIAGHSITLIVREGLEWMAEDPPDPNFTEVATLEPVEPIEPGCDAPLIIAWAEFLTKIKEQHAITTALMTSVERLQGAVIAEEPEFVSLQAQAVAQFSNLLSANQAELVTCTTALQSIYSTEIGPMEDDLRAILEQVIAEGFTPDQYGTLIDAGLTDEEIGWLDNLFNDVSPTGDPQGFLDWTSFVEEIMIPGLIGMFNQMNTVVETLEQIANPPASNNPPAFDVPPSPPAGTEFTIAVGDALTFTVQASDPDVGDEVNLEIMEAPSGATLSVSKVGYISTGSFSWTPAADQTGVHVLTFVATDNYGLPAAPHQVVVVVPLINQPPVADAGHAQTVEQSSYEGAEVALDGSGSYDPDGDELTYEWTWVGGLASSVNPTPVFPLGTTTVTLSVSDGQLSDTDTMDVTVVDTTPPEISVSVSPDTLWPPNHKMVEITATVTVKDICDTNPIVTLSLVTSNEPDDANGSGDGNTVNDIQGADIGTQDYCFSLRAERAGSGNGRIYTITYTVTDAAENSANAEATVTVPHDQRKGGNGKGKK